MTEILRGVAVAAMTCDCCGLEIAAGKYNFSTPNSADVFCSLDCAEKGRTPMSDEELAAFIGLSDFEEGKAESELLP